MIPDDDDYPKIHHEGERDDREDYDWDHDRPGKGLHGDITTDAPPPREKDEEEQD